MAGSDLPQPVFAMVQHGAANIFTTPLGQQKGKVTITASTIRSENPPDSGVADNLALHLYEKHVLVWVAIDQMPVSAGNIFNGLGTVDLVRIFGSLNDCHHGRIVLLAAEPPEGQTKNGWRVGDLDHVF